MDIKARENKSGIRLPKTGWLLLLMPSVCFGADVYQCEVDGKTTFSQFPCAEDAQLITVTEPKGLHGGGLSEGELVEQCFRYLVETSGFKDKESARVESHYTAWREDASGARRVMVLKINAKNSYGGYSGGENYDCYLNQAGDGLSKVQWLVAKPEVTE